MISAWTLSGCSKPSEPTLRVATNVWSGYETLYLARSLGYFDELPIRLIELPSSSQVSENLRAGLVDAACLTLDETLSLIHDGVDLRVVLVMDESVGADVLMALPEIADLQSLRGKRVGVESGAVGAILLDAALETAGLRVDEVQLVPLTVDEHMRAYRDGAVDAVVTFEPVRSQLLKEGARVLFDSSSIPGRIVDVMVVRTDAVSARTGSLRELIQGHFRALDHMALQPQDAATRMSPRLGDDPLAQFEGIVQPDLAGNREALAGSSPRLENAARALAELMRRQKLLERPIRIDAIADPHYLPVDQP